MDIIRTKTCCCCISPRTGVTILAVASLVVYIVLLTFIAAVIEDMPLQAERNEVDTDLVCGIILAWIGLALFVNLALLAGVRMDKPVLMMPAIVIGWGESIILFVGISWSFLLGDFVPAFSAMVPFLLNLHWTLVTTWYYIDLCQQFQLVRLESVKCKS